MFPYVSSRPEEDVLVSQPGIQAAVWRIQRDGNSENPPIPSKIDIFAIGNRYSILYMYIFYIYIYIYMVLFIHVCLHIHFRYLLYIYREREIWKWFIFFLPKRWIIQSGLSQMPLVPGDERHVRSVHVRQRRHGVCSFLRRKLFFEKKRLSWRVSQMSSCNHKWRAEEVTSPEADPEESEGEANVLQKSRCANCIKWLVLQKTLVLSGWAIPCAGRS